MTLRAAFLDVGDTLLTERTPRHAIYAAAAQRWGVEVDPGEMRVLMRRAHHALPLELEGAYRYSDPWFEVFIETIFGEYLGIAKGSLEPLTRELFERFEDPRTFRLFDGARELLTGLRERGLWIAVVSNWSARLERVLAGLELLEGVDAVHSSALEGAEKPDPSFFQRALERAGHPPEETLHAGDHPEKDGGARELGIEVILVDHFERHPDSDLPRVVDLFSLQRLIEERAHG